MKKVPVGLLLKNVGTLLMQRAQCLFCFKLFGLVHAAHTAHVAACGGCGSGRLGNISHE